MIDEALLAKFDRIQDLSVSEEMLGAYIEGNLSLSAADVVDKNIQFDTQVETLLGEVYLSDKFQFSNIDWIAFQNELDSLLNLPELADGNNIVCEVASNSNDLVVAFDPMDLNNISDISFNSDEIFKSSEFSFDKDDRNVNECDSIDSDKVDSDIDDIDSIDDLSF